MTAAVCDTTSVALSWVGESAAYFSLAPAPRWRGRPHVPSTGSRTYQRSCAVRRAIRTASFSLRRWLRPSRPRSPRTPPRTPSRPARSSPPSSGAP